VLTGSCLRCTRCPTVLVQRPVNALLVEMAVLGVSIRAATRDNFRFVGIKS